jgi:hypothetical protein
MPSESKHLEEEKKAALEFTISYGVSAAAKEFGVARKTIWNWQQEFPEYWSSLRAGDREVQKQHFAQRLEDLSEHYSALELEALARAETLIKKADPKELAALIRAMGASRGVSAAGARSFRGDDAQRLEIDVNFPMLEAAANAILERAKPAPLLVENVEDADDK